MQDNQDWVDFLVEVDHLPQGGIFPGEEDTKTYIYKPGYKSVSQEVRKQWLELAELDAKTGEFDRLLRQRPQEGGLFDDVWGQLISNGYVQREDAEEFHQKYIDEHPEPITYSRDSLNGYLYPGLEYINSKARSQDYLKTASQSALGLDRSTFERFVFDPQNLQLFGIGVPFTGTGESKNPYLGVFSQDRRDTILERQRQLAENMGKFALTPLPTRDATGKVIYEADRVDKIDRKDLGEGAWEAYAKVADAKADELFDHGTYMEVGYNWLMEEDQLSRAIPADPDFSYSENFKIMQDLEKDMPTGVVERIRESKSIAEAMAVRQAATKEQSLREMYQSYFGDSYAGAIGQFAMDMSIGFADPAALATGAITGGIGSFIGRAKWGQQGLAAWSKRAVLDGGIGAAEGAAYMHLYAQNSDPLREDADYATGIATGFALGTAFELGFGDVASDFIGNTKLGKRLGLKAEKEATIASQIDTESRQVTRTRERIERIELISDEDETNRVLDEQNVDADVERVSTASDAVDSTPEVIPIDPEIQAEIDALDDLPTRPVGRRIAIFDIKNDHQKNLVEKAIEDGLIKMDEDGNVLESDALAVINENFTDTTELNSREASRLLSTPAINFDVTDKNNSLILDFASQTTRFFARLFRGNLDDIPTFNNAIGILSVIADPEMDIVAKYNSVFDLIQRDLPFNIKEHYLKLVGDGIIEDGSLRALFDFYNNYKLELDENGNVIEVRRESPIMADTALINDRGFSNVVAELRQGFGEVAKISDNANVLDPEVIFSAKSLASLGDYPVFIEIVRTLATDPEAAPITLRAIEILENDENMTVDLAFQKASNEFLGSQFDPVENPILDKVYDDPRGLDYVYHKFKESPILQQLLDRVVPKTTLGDLDTNMPSQSVIMQFSARLRTLEAKLNDTKNPVQVSDAEMAALREAVDVQKAELTRIRQGLKRLGASTEAGVKRTLKRLAEGKKLNATQTQALYEYVGIYDIGLLRTLAADELNLELDVADIPRPDYNKPIVRRAKKATRESVKNYIEWYRQLPERTKKVKAALKEQTLLRKRYERIKRGAKTAKTLLDRRKNMNAQLARVESALTEPSWKRTIEENANLRRAKNYLLGAIEENDKHLQALGESLGVIIDTDSVRSIEAELAAYGQYFQQARTNVEDALRGKYGTKVDPNKAGFITMDLLLGPVLGLAKALKSIFKNITKLDPRNLSPDFRKRKEQIRKQLLTRIMNELAADLKDPSARNMNLRARAQMLAKKYNLSQPEAYDLLQKLFERRVGAPGKRPAFWDSANPLDEPSNPLLDKHRLFSISRLKETLKEIDAFLESTLGRDFEEGFFDFDYDLATEEQLSDRLSTVFDALERVERLTVDEILGDRKTPELERVYKALGIEPTEEKRYDLFRYYARLAGFTGNILAPESIKDTIYTRLTGKMHYIPNDIIFKEIPHYNEFDFELYHKSHTQNFFPFASDYVYSDQVGDNLTYGMIVDLLSNTNAIMRDVGVTQFLEDAGLMVITPHRTVIVELEKLFRPLSDLALERAITEEDVMAVLGPVGATGLPTKLEALLVPSSKQEAWKRWVANVKEVLGGVTPAYPKERARLHKRRAEQIAFIIKNPREFNLSPGDILDLRDQYNLNIAEYTKLKNLVENPLLKDVFGELQDLLDRYAEFFDESSEAWAKNYALERDKSVIEDQIQRLTIRLEDTLDQLQSIGGDDANELSEGVKKAINQIYLLGGMDEKYPELSVDVKRLELLRSAPFMPNRVPPALFEQIRFRLNAYISRLRSQHGAILPSDVQAEVDNIKDFIADLKGSAEDAKDFVDQTRVQNTNAELRDSFDDLETRLSQLDQQFDNLMGADDSRLPFQNLRDEVQDIVREAFDEYLDNTQNLMNQLKVSEFGKPVQKVDVGPFQPIPSIAKKARVVRERQREIIKNYFDSVDEFRTIDDLRAWVTAEERSGQLNSTTMAKVILKAVELQDGGRAEALEFIDGILKDTTLSDDTRTLFGAFKAQHIAETYSDFGLLEELRSLTRLDDDGPDLTPFSGGLPPIAFEDIVAGLAYLKRKFQNLYKTIIDWVKGSAAEFKMIYKGTFLKELRPANQRVFSAAHYIATAGWQVPFVAFKTLLGPLNKLRSMRSRAGANELGIIRMLGRMIYGSDLYQLQDGKLYNGGDNHAKRLAPRFGLTRYRQRLLGKLLAKIEDLHIKKGAILKLMNIDDAKFNELVGFVYHVIAIEKQKDLVAGKKPRSINEILGDLTATDATIELLTQAVDQGMEIPQELNPDLTDRAHIAEFIDFIKSMDILKKTLANQLPEDSPLRLSLENEFDVVVISNDSLLDVDRVLEIGYFERIIYDSLSFSEEPGSTRTIQPNSKAIVAYLIAREIRAGKSSLLSQVNILTNLRKLDRASFISLLREHLEPEALREVFAQFRHGQFATMNKAEMIDYFTNQIFPQQSFGRTLPEMLENLRTPLYEKLSQELKPLTIVRAALDKLVNKGVITSNERALYLDYLSRRKTNPESLTEGHKKVADKVNQVIDDAMEDVINKPNKYLEKMRASLRELLKRDLVGGITISLPGRATKRQTLSLKVTEDVILKLRDVYSFTIVRDLYGTIDIKKTLEGLAKKLDKIPNTKDLDDFFDILMELMVADKFASIDKLSEKERKALTSESNVNTDKITIKIDAKRKHSAKINRNVLENEEFTRVSNSPKLASKIDEKQTTLEDFSLEDIASTNVVDDLEAQGRRVIDESTESEFLAEIHDRMDDAGVKTADGDLFRFETADEFFDFLLKEGDTLVKQGKLTNLKEFVRMIEVMRSHLTGKTPNNQKRFIGDFVRLMQKGATAFNTLGFGVAATVELGVATARNLNRLISFIPGISNIIDGTQKIENFEGEIKASKKKRDKLIEKRSKLVDQVGVDDDRVRKLNAEIDELTNKISDLDKKQELALDIIYGSGVGTEGALFRSTGSNRRSLVFDQKNPLSSAASRPDEVGKPSTARKAAQAVEKYTERVAQEAAEGNPIPAIPGLPKAAKPLSLNAITEFTQRVIFNSMMTKILRRIEKLDLVDSNTGKPYTTRYVGKGMPKHVAQQLAHSILPEVILRQIGMSDKGLVRIAIAIQQAIKDNPPRKKNGFTYYDLGSILHHPAVTPQNRQLLQSSLYNWIGQNVTRPDAGDLPAIMSQGFLSLMSQFRSFGVAMFSKAIMPLVQRSLGPNRGADLKVRGGASISLAVMAVLQATYNYMMWAVYNTEEAKEDLQEQGPLSLMAQGAGDLLQGNLSEEDRTTLTPGGRIWLGTLFSMLGIGGFGAEQFYTFTGVQDPTSWYEQDYRGADQEAKDIANGIAAYRFYKGHVKQPIQDFGKLTNAAFDADIREAMAEEFNYDEGNIFQKIDRAGQAAGLKEGAIGQDMARSAGNYRFYKIAEALYDILKD